MDASQDNVMSQSESFSNSQQQSSSVQPSQPTTSTDKSKDPQAPKRGRRTKKEMAEWRDQQKRIRLQKEQDREMAKLVKEQEKQAKKLKTSKSTRPSQSSELEDTEDRGKAFSFEDYENIMSYLEDEKNYTSIYGDGSKTAVGVKPMTKIQAFEVFATWLNQLNPDLLLNGRRLQQRITRWRKKYVETKRFEENTGAGIEELDGPQNLYDLLEEKCPCYHRLDILLGQKANVTSMYEFDHSMPSQELPQHLPNDEEDDGAVGNDNLEDEHAENHMDSSPEIFYSGWDPTQSTASADELPDSLSLPNSTPTPQSMNFPSLSSLDLAGYRPAQAHSQAPAANLHNSQTRAGSTSGQSRPQATPTPSERGRNSSRGRGRPTPIGKTGSMANAQSAPPQVAPKATLAAAFSNSTDTRFQMVESQMNMERERMNREDARAQRKDDQERTSK
ncbi:hypothetical protein PGT21_029307 [Puccinia graminis f. sp. tritici]|uniref:Uncharacterized protein n=1 Tax=Puccinia graminis f. sp. tritici TaxID=56615 RepID=A0A5B0MQE8_PUCGR|nr:hypothetical protein PGT21_029307 [Puccinia graminis f. sp. tritici]